MIDNYKPTKKDYSEDFKLENGNYNCHCVECGKIFVGHKRRVICKECENEKFDSKLEKDLFHGNINDHITRIIN